MSIKLLGDGLLVAHNRQHMPLGTTKTLNNGNRLRYTKLSTSESVLPVQGSPLAWRAASDYNSMTSDLSRSRDDFVAGVNYASGLSTTKPYGWMLEHGNPELDGVTLKTDGNVAADQVLIFGADKVFHGVTIDSDQRARAVGYAAAADSGSQLVSCQITGYTAG